MLLYLARHGEAVAEDVDPGRPLSARGREEVMKVASFLKSHWCEMDHVWHSTKGRARETAALIAEALKFKGSFVEKTGLAPDDPIQDAREGIRDLFRSECEACLLIAGHAPFLPRLASWLLTGEEKTAEISLPTGGVLCLESADGEKWQLNWLLKPEDI